MEYGEKPYWIRREYYSIRENALKNTEKLNSKKPFFSAFCGIYIVNYLQTGL